MSVQVELKKKITVLKTEVTRIEVHQKRNFKQKMAILRRANVYGNSAYSKSRLSELKSQDAALDRSDAALRNEIKITGDCICRLREIRRGTSKRTVESVLLQYAMNR